MKTKENSLNGKFQVWTSKNILGEDIEWGNNDYFQDGYDEFESYELALDFIKKYKDFLFEAEVAGMYMLHRGEQIDLLN